MAKKLCVATGFLAAISFVVSIGLAGYAFANDAVGSPAWVMSSAVILFAVALISYCACLFCSLFLRS